VSLIFATHRGTDLTSSTHDDQKRHEQPRHSWQEINAPKLPWVQMLGVRESQHSVATEVKSSLPKGHHGSDQSPYRRSLFSLHIQEKPVKRDQDFSDIHISLHDPKSIVQIFVVWIDLKINVIK